MIRFCPAPVYQKERHLLSADVFLFGLRPPKAASALRYFNAWRKHPQGVRHIRRAEAANGCAVNPTCAKVFACGENACTAQKRRGPERPLGGTPVNRAKAEKIDFNRPFQSRRKRHTACDELFHFIAKRVVRSLKLLLASNRDPERSRCRLTDAACPLRVLRRDRG